MFIDPKPETRLLFGDSSELVKIIKHFHDSVHDLLVDLWYWSPAIKEKYKK